MKNFVTAGWKKSLLNALLGFGVALVATQAHAQAYPVPQIKLAEPLLKRCQRFWVKPLWLKTELA
jgi:hypothetical protein